MSGAPRLITQADTLPITDFPGYVVGNWYLPFGMPGTLIAGSAPGLNSIRLTPGYVKQTCTVNSLGVRVTTLFAGGNTQAAIYASDPVTMKPTGSALASTASMSTAAAGSVNSAVSVQLTPGLYWFATNLDNATAALAGENVGNAALSTFLGSATQSNCLGSGQSFVGLAIAATFGNWPSLTAASFAEVTFNGTVGLVQFKIGSVP